MAHECSGEQSGPQTANVRGNHYGREEGHVRDGVAEYRPKQPPDHERRRRGQDSQTVRDKSGVWSFVHA